MLAIRNASVRFASSDGTPVVALDRVSLDIESESIVVVLGASGCGKSTLLNAVAGFRPLDEGSILLDGREINGPGADRGVVFQKDSLLPWLNLLDNVALGLKYHGLSRWQRHERARQLLALVGLEEFATRAPYELSGGMRQRVGIARALSTDPKILLMDEPFGALDSFTRESMQQLLVSLWSKAQKQVLFITHSIEEALLLGTRVVVMSPRPGRILKSYDTKFVHGFIAAKDAGPIISNPQFVELRSEIRELIHSPSGIERGGKHVGAVGRA